MSNERCLSFNLNECVKVKITKHGHKILLEEHTKFRAEVLMRTNNDVVGPYAPRKTDSNGYVEMPLWQVMKDFGHHMSLTSNLVIETDILIPLPPND